MSEDNSTVVTLKVRVTPEFREKIIETAKSNSRSMNAEIVHRLEQSFNPHLDLSNILSAADQANADKTDSEKSSDESRQVLFNTIAYSIFNTLNKSGYLLIKDEKPKPEDAS